MTLAYRHTKHELTLVLATGSQSTQFILNILSPWQRHEKIRFTSETMAYGSPQWNINSSEFNSFWPFFVYQLVGSFISVLDPILDLCVSRGIPTQDPFHCPESTASLWCSVFETMASPLTQFKTISLIDSFLLLSVLYNDFPLLEVHLRTCH